MSRQLRRWRVSGRVQGVYFRASTREQALALGLDGQAVNQADGSVEVVAAGPREALDQLDRWLHHGPPQARVDAVQAMPAPATVPAGFSIG
jgi:acylphosphatase